MRFVYIILFSISMQVSLAQMSNVSNLWTPVEEKADKLFELNLYSEALNQYLLTMDKGKEDQELYLKIARCYYKLRNFEEAVEYFDGPIDKNVGQPVYRQQDVLEFAESLLAIGEKEKARTYFTLYNGMAEDNSSRNRILGIESQTKFFLDQENINIELNRKVSSKFSDIAVVPYLNGIVFSSQGEFSWPVDNQYLMGEMETYGLYFAEKKKDSLEYRNPRPIVISKMYFNITSPTFLGDSLVVFSAGRQHIPLARKNPENYLSLFEAKIKDEFNWSRVRRLDIELPGGSMISPSFSPTGDTLFFSSDSPAGNGGFDLYMTQCSDSGWTIPQALPDWINSEQNELYPVYRDNRLYFSGDGHQGMGGLDIFYADFRQQRVINFGFPLNSSYDDFSLAFDQDGDGSSGLFVSNRKEGIGKDDIYFFSAKLEEKSVVQIRVKEYHSEQALARIPVKVSRNGEFQTLQSDRNGLVNFYANLDDSVFIEVDSPPYNLLIDSLSVVGKKIEKELILKRNYALKAVVQTEEDYQAVPMPHIFTTNLETGEHQEMEGNVNGYFVLEAAAGSTLAFEITADGYNFTLDTVTFDDPVNTRNFLVKRVEKFETITLNDLLYDVDQYKLSSDQIPTLDSLASIMNRLPTVEILVVSHTDSKGESIYNFKLSQKRAESVLEYLMKQGISRSRILAEGRGESQLINGCKDGVPCSEEEHKVNRRTEIFVFYNE